MWADCEFWEVRAYLDYFTLSQTVLRNMKLSAKCKQMNDLHETEPIARGIRVIDADCPEMRG